MKLYRKGERVIMPHSTDKRGVVLANQDKPGEKVTVLWDGDVVAGWIASGRIMLYSEWNAKQHEADGTLATYWTSEAVQHD